MPLSRPAAAPHLQPRRLRQRCQLAAGRALRHHLCIDAHAPQPAAQPPQHAVQKKPRSRSLRPAAGPHAAASGGCGGGGGRDGPRSRTARPRASRSRRVAGRIGRLGRLAGSRGEAGDGCVLQQLHQLGMGHRQRSAFHAGAAVQQLAACQIMAASVGAITGAAAAAAAGCGGGRGGCCTCFSAAAAQTRQLSIQQHAHPGCMPHRRHRAGRVPKLGQALLGRRQPHKPPRQRKVARQLRGRQGEAAAGQAVSCGPGAGAEEGMLGLRQAAAGGC